MSAKLSIIGPVLNEIEFIGYSIMAGLEGVHEFIYALDEKSSDGTRDLLHYIKDKYAHEKLTILDHPTFHPHDMAAYNGAFTRCIEKSTGDAVGFIHPDMIITKWVDLKEGPLAWTVNVKSYAGDFQTQITKGRVSQWKNIHAKKFGLKYFGGYGSVNEDFYHADITGTSYKHYGTDFWRYPFEVAQSGIEISHYCELKSYRRRLEKMKLCLKTQYPNAPEDVIQESATQHPRVTLEPSASKFGEFRFAPAEAPIPDVFTKYKDEFESFKKEKVLI